MIIQVKFWLGTAMALHVKVVESPMAENWFSTLSEAGPKFQNKYSTVAIETDTPNHLKANSAKDGVTWQNRDFKIQWRDDNETRTTKNNSFNEQINNFALAWNFFCTFPGSFCTTTTWKWLISRFMKNVTKHRRNFIFLSIITWIWCLGIRIQDGSPTFDKVSGWK